MEIFPYEDTIQFVVMFLSLAFVGGIFTGMLLGYLWIQLKQLGILSRTGRKKIYASNYFEVFPYSVLHENLLQKYLITSFKSEYSSSKVSLHSA